MTGSPVLSACGAANRITSRLVSTPAFETISWPPHVPPLQAGISMPARRIECLPIRSVPSTETALPPTVCASWNVSVVAPTT